MPEDRVRRGRWTQKVYPAEKARQGVVILGKRWQCAVSSWT